MSNIQTGAERMPHDLSHLGFLAGQIGRLITISTTPVIAGDSFEMDAVGALRLSRSEERRVGKECRSRWALLRSKKNSAGSTAKSSLLSSIQRVSRSRTCDSSLSALASPRRV